MKQVQLNFKYLEKKIEKYKKNLKYRNSFRKYSLGAEDKSIEFNSLMKVHHLQLKNINKESNIIKENLD